MENVKKFRDISNLNEYELKGAVSLTILTGVYHKPEFHGNINGNQVDSDEKYFVHMLANTDYTQGVSGFVVTKIQMPKEAFEAIFKDELTFMTDWAFKPVFPMIVKDQKDRNTLASCMLDPRIPLKQQGVK